MGKKPKRPAKHDDVPGLCRRRIEQGRFRDTAHALEQRRERGITLDEMLMALRSGRHEKKKDKFEELPQAWNYAMRGKTVDGRELRIVVSFDDAGMMLVITAMEVR